MYDDFKQTVWDYYHDHGRDLPWRHSEPDGSFDPYKITVSEIMLQQTQAARVIPKYHEFLAIFPTAESLATAPLADVLKVWSGLGYNRRAKFLWQATQQIKGAFPDTIEQLVALPGIGSNTAGAILAYSFNKPIVFIETNIRTVYIHHFFADRIDVHDNEILPLVEATFDKENPREWYWALMDYGTYIKANVGNVSRNSRHYAKQPTFKGSKRQIRGQVIRLLTNGQKPYAELVDQVRDKRLDEVLSELQKEQMIRLDSAQYRLW